MNTGIVWVIVAVLAIICMVVWLANNTNVFQGG